LTFDPLLDHTLENTNSVKIAIKHSVLSPAVLLLFAETLFSGTGLGVLGAVKFDTPFPVGIPLSAVL